MIPSKVRQHLDKHFKNRNCMKKTGNYELQVDFCNLENINVENISFSCEENWAKVCH